MHATSIVMATESMLLILRRKIIQIPFKQIPMGQITATQHIIVIGRGTLCSTVTLAGSLASCKILTVQRGFLIVGAHNCQYLSIIVESFWALAKLAISGVLDSLLGKNPVHLLMACTCTGRIIRGLVFAYGGFFLAAPALVFGTVQACILEVSLLLCPDDHFYISTF